MITNLFLVIFSILEGCSHIPAQALPCQTNRFGLLYLFLQLMFFRLLTNLISISSGLSPVCYLLLMMTSPNLWLKFPQAKQSSAAAGPALQGMPGTHLPGSQQQTAAEPDQHSPTETPRQQHCSPAGEFLHGVCVLQVACFAFVFTELLYINFK